MESATTAELIENLERVIRLNTPGSSLIQAEPVNEDLVSELAEVIEDLSADVRDPGFDIDRISESVLLIKESDRQPSAVQVQTPVSSQVNSTEAVSKSRPEDANSLDSLRLRLLNCTICPLCIARKTVVTGQGNQQAKLIFVGEGPGADEDQKGLAFVGKAGQLLTQVIHAIGINRESVFICNVVKCRPPGNRTPEKEEIAACLPFLKRQIELIQPKLIVSLGNVATKALVPNAGGITSVRGKLAEYQGIPLIPTFHPSYLLRQPSALKAVWVDMRLVRQVLFRNAS